MRFLTFALGALGLAASTAGQESRWHPSKTVNTSWHPSQTTSSCSYTTTASWTPPSLTLPKPTGCPSYFNVVSRESTTSVCTEPTTTSCDYRPCATSRYAYYDCVTISNDFGGTRSRRFVAQYTKATTSTSSVAPLPTNDFGGLSQSLVARFAEPTITADPNPAEVADPPFPTCSFDLEKGQYICPPNPTCTFNLEKGQYICSTTAGATTAAEPSLEPFDLKNPRQACSACFDTIQKCQDKCGRENNNDCMLACPCNVYFDNPLCSECRTWKVKCDNLPALEKKNVTTITAVDTGSDPLPPP